MKCNCGKGEAMYLGELCEDCYEGLFTISSPPQEEDEGFELKSEVATITESNISNEFVYTQLDNGRLLRVNIDNGIKLDKYYVFNKDSRVKDYDALVEFLLANMLITEKAKGFEKVSYMFKEVE